MNRQLLKYEVVNPVEETAFLVGFLAFIVITVGFAFMIAEWGIMFIKWIGGFWNGF